ncbi:hypothetical protein F5887DRAFT_1063579 [Amanita rubescens]|nr:hypothetical protein F5887DRAFT_1063579 [Amanita rubescens]
MTRTRIESLLASFPKLIPTNTQHTSVETTDVRYIYRPLEDLYILLITNKASNTFQDIDTLIYLRAWSQKRGRAGDLEARVVCLGYREQVNLVQARNILEMGSHERYKRSLPRRNKEAEAKEELKWRTKQLEIRSLKQQTCCSYSPVPRFEAPEAVTRINTASPISSTPRAPAFKGTGMKLGAKKTSQAELLDES